MKLKYLFFYYSFDHLIISNVQMSITYISGKVD